MSVRRPDIHVHVLASTEPRRMNQSVSTLNPARSEKQRRKICASSTESSTHRSVEFLETLEALYIREIGPTLNTKDEYRSRELSILFWFLFCLVFYEFLILTNLIKILFYRWRFTDDGRKDWIYNDQTTFSSILTHIFWKSHLFPKLAVRRAKYVH